MTRAGGDTAAPALLLLLLLGATAAVYWPGLHGPFLFDDFGTLPALGDFNGVRDLHSLVLFLTGGITGPSGRPLSLASFLIDDYGWPSEPFAFKWTNLAFHLLNGVLFAALVLVLARMRGVRRPDWVAAIAAGAWLLHPLFVSTTLYVVQRMTILVTLFSLLGLIAYVHGRRALQDRPRRGYALLVFATVAAPVLAILCKENGALLPLLYLVLEATLLRGCVPALPRHFALLFLYAPLLLVLAALATQWRAIEHIYAMRDFGPGQRLLTEAGVLVSYLRQIVIPYPDPGGLFHDDFAVARGILAPATLGPVLLLAIGTASALWLRRRNPWFALAVLFFLAGHALESTVVPLELYFEHRNYLPAMFLFVLPALWVVESSSAPIRLAIAAWIGVATVVTAVEARLWGDETRLLATWAAERPTSERAQRTYALHLEQQGRPDLALAAVIEARHRLPASTELALYEGALRCRVGALTPVGLAHVSAAVRSNAFDFRSFGLLDTLARRLARGACRGLPPAAVDGLLDAVARNPHAHLSGAGRQIAHLRGEILALRGEGTGALAAFARSLELVPDVDAGLKQVSLLAAAGFPAEALRHLQQVDALLRRSPGGFLRQIKARVMDYPAEVERLRVTLQKDAARTALAAP